MTSQVCQRDICGLERIEIAIEDAASQRCVTAPRNEEPCVRQVVRHLLFDSKLLGCLVYRYPSGRKSCPIGGEPLLGFRPLQQRDTNGHGCRARCMGFCSKLASDDGLNEHTMLKDSDIARYTARRTHRTDTSAFKAELVAACLQPGTSIAALAGRHGMNANVLHRSKSMHAQAATSPPAPMRVQPWRISSTPS